MRLVSLHVESEIPNSSCFIGKSDSHKPAQCNQYSSSAKNCITEESFSVSGKGKNFSCRIFSKRICGPPTL
jgi:hypothetical protein